jgi:hypothetical protein
LETEHGFETAQKADRFIVESAGLDLKSLGVEVSLCGVEG